MVVINVFIFPILVSLWFSLAFLLTYGIALKHNHVTIKTVPYISDSGTFSPESCIFGQMINIGALLLLFVMYVRYLFIKELYRNYDLSDSILEINKIAAKIGVASVFGLSIVANFQESNVLTIHIFGAAVGFGFGCVHIILQTLLTDEIYPVSGTKGILYARRACSALCAISFSITILSAAIAFPQYKGSNIAKWGKDDGGYIFHLISTSSEWITVTSGLGFFFTYAPEFQKIYLHEPILCIKTADYNC